jgi:uncharacterized protein YbbC (DUF1343 family)
MLQGIDTMVIDLQDIGARFYTYMTTMAYVMEEAAKRKIAVWCWTGRTRSTAGRSRGRRSTRTARRLHGYFPMPIRHGMTLGELARLFNGENARSART